MKVRTICSDGAIVALARQNLEIAATRMVANSVSALVVVRGARPIGIITERDITRAVADGVDVVLTKVGEYMAPDPQTVHIDDETEDVAEQMSELAVRHLPVVDDAGLLVGVVSARDLLILHQWPLIRRASSASA